MSNLSYQSFGDSRGGSDSERKLAAIQLPDLQGKRLLDLGCNAGFFCRSAKDLGASRVVGIDRSRDVIELAKARHPDVEFHARHWDDFPDGKFDVIMCLSAIHYARSFFALAHNVRDHLSSGGLWIIEGGLVDKECQRWSTAPVPVWRKVGDRVRHLSGGFLKAHLLTAFQWSVIGPSISQGGDPVGRFVIHAFLRDSGEPPPAPMKISIRELVADILVSRATIAPSHKDYELVQFLGSSEDLPSLLASARFSTEFREPFAELIQYLVGDHSGSVVVEYPDDRSAKLLGTALASTGVICDGLAET